MSELLPRTWNNGIVEYWKVGFNKEFIRIFALLTSLSRGILPMTHFSIFPKPIIPSFHCSIIPIAEQSGAKFLLPALCLLIPNQTYLEFASTLNQR